MAHSLFLEETWSLWCSIEEHQSILSGRYPWGNDFEEVPDEELRNCFDLLGVAVSKMRNIRDKTATKTGWKDKGTQISDRSPQLLNFSAPSSPSPLWLNSKEIRIIAVNLRPEEYIRIRISEYEYGSIRTFKRRYRCIHIYEWDYEFCCIQMLVFALTASISA